MGSSSTFKFTSSTTTFFKMFCRHDPTLLWLSFGVFPTFKNLRRWKRKRISFTQFKLRPSSYMSILDVLTCWRSGESRLNVNVCGAFGASDIDRVDLMRLWSSSGEMLLLPSTKSLLPLRFSRWSNELVSERFAFMKIVLPPKYWLRNSDRFSIVSWTCRCWRIWQCASISAIKNLFRSRSEKSLTLSEPKNFCMMISWSSSLSSSVVRRIVL